MFMRVVRPAMLYVRQERELEVSRVEDVEVLHGNDENS